MRLDCLHQIGMHCHQRKKTTKRGKQKAKRKLIRNCFGETIKLEFICPLFGLKAKVVEGVFGI